MTYATSGQLLAEKECRAAVIGWNPALENIREIPIDVYYADEETLSTHNPSLTFRPINMLNLDRAAFFLAFTPDMISEAHVAGCMVIALDTVLKFDGFSCIVSDAGDMGEVLALNVARYRAEPQQFAEDQFRQVKHLNEMVSDIGLIWNSKEKQETNMGMI